MTWLLRIVEALNSAHFHGVPVEEPSTASEAEMREFLSFVQPGG
jgi:hypothetical protein